MEHCALKSRTMKCFILIRCLIALCSAPSILAGALDKPEPRIKRVLIVSIDHLRPDVLLRANTPMLHAMMEHDVTTYDTFATACFVLGIGIDHRIDGKPIRQIFDNQEMMISTFQPTMAPATN
jgi:hypothetical protein